MDFTEDTIGPNNRRRVIIAFEGDELQDLRRAERNNGLEAIEAMGKAAGALLLQNGVTRDTCIVSPLYSYGFEPGTCYYFLGALRNTPGLEFEDHVEA